MYFIKLFFQAFIRRTIGKCSYKRWVTYYATLCDVCSNYIGSSHNWTTSILVGQSLELWNNWHLCTSKIFTNKRFRIYLGVCWSARLFRDGPLKKTNWNFLIHSRLFGFWFSSRFQGIIDIVRSQLSHIDLNEETLDE